MEEIFTAWADSCYRVIAMSSEFSTLSNSVLGEFETFVADLTGALPFDTVLLPRKKCQFRIVVSQIFRTWIRMDRAEKIDKVRAPYS